jgi:signal transduction histidine kinase/CheY-like chemotaxis protein
MATDQRIMNGGVAEQVEEEVRLADGSAAVWLSVKAPFFSETGEVVGLIGSSIDVTARKQAEASVQNLNQTLEQRVRDAISEREQVEDALRQSQKMEAVGQLTGGIAHDFNNLLAGISGSLELMQMRLNQGRVADVDRYLVVAQGAVQRAAALTHRLLAFSRRQTLAPIPTDVNALIMGMEELIRRTVGPSIDIQVRNAADLWSALIDPAQLENSLLNLCINARDAMPHGGRILIETCNERLDESNDLDPEVLPGEYLSICVSDSGCGMSPEVAARAFEPFFTTKPVGEGTGLGLSMIYGFARQSGGQIRIRSEVSQGTTVCLQLPRHERGVEASPPPSPVSDGALAGQGETVLVVDDESSVRMLVTEVLSGLGYVAIEAADSLAGLRILQSDVRIDLLVTDVGLPGGINGRQMADAGRECRPGLPVLFITGYAETTVLDKCHLEPLTEVLTKPFPLEALASRIKELIKAR